MHITIVTRQDLFPPVHGGAAKIVRTAEALSRHGVGVSIVTGDRLRYHLFEEGLHRELPYPVPLVAATRVPPRLDRWLRRLGLPEWWASLEGLLDTLGYPRDEHLLYRPVVDPDFWLRTIWVGIRHDTAWFQAEFPGFLVPAWVAARTLGARCSVMEHNIEWKRLADTTALPAAVLARLRGIEVQLLHLADEVICCSDEDRSLLLGDDFERNEVTVVPHGVDVDAFTGKSGHGLRQRYDVPDGDALLFFHGTLHYWPNTVACRILAEEILPRLERRGLAVTVVVAGLNPPRHHSHEKLRYAGVVDDLPAHVAAADLCVVPLLDGGGTRLKILEYFAGARAVVSTRKGAEGLRARDGVEIERVDDGDWDTFADRVQALLADTSRRRGLGALARRHVEDLSWARVAGAILQLYRGGSTVRGTDFFSALHRAPELATEDPVTVGTRLLAEDRAERLRVLRKELHKEDGSNIEEPPRWVHWTPEQVRYEHDDTSITAHLPADTRWQKPRTMILLLNKRCNLKCDFCDLWHHTDMMPFETAATVIARAPPAGVRTLVITGGEPFVHPRIWDVIELARNLDLGVNITTNGVLLRRDLPRLVRARINSLSISLDGFGETHDRLRGVPGCYEDVMLTLDALAPHREIALNIYFVVTNRNVQDLAAVHDLCLDRGIAFDFWPVNGYPHLYLQTDDDRSRYREAIDHIARTRPEVEARRGYYEYGLDYHAGKRDHLRCLGLIEQFGVNHQGQVVPCCVWDQKGLQVGSAVDEPLDQLFYSERAQRLRRTIHDVGCVDQCFNHSLYEFQAATGQPFVVQEAKAAFDPTQAVVKESGQQRGRPRRKSGRTLEGRTP